MDPEFESTPEPHEDEPSAAPERDPLSELEEHLRTDEKQRQAAALRIAGVPLQVIADRLGYASPSGAWHAAEAGLNKMLAGHDAGAKRLALARLDEMLMGVWRKARAGDTAAIAAVLRIEERRAKFLGLDLTAEPPTVTPDSELDRARKAREDRQRGAASA